ncbi:MAG: hypothetical protein AAFN91_10460, partial [Pseudomonadota bacterium]
FGGGGGDPAVSPALASLDTNLIRMPMIAGVRWEFSVGDSILFLGFVMLFIEVVKATSTRSTAIINHGASMLVLMFCVFEFLLLKSFATSEFFLLTMMCFLDVLAGVMVTIVSARRDFGVGDGFSG